MKKIALAAAIFIYTVTGTALAEDFSVVKWASGHRSYSIDLYGVQRKGNISYIPINQTVNDVVASTIALDVMEKFQRENPKLKVVTWNPVYMTPVSLGSNVSGIRFVGIYITHNLKK
jgi:hypothetical protein